MAQAPAEMLLMTKTYEFLLWLNGRIGKFPRDQRFTLGDRILNRGYELLELLLQAKYTVQRQPLLQSANLQLELLRFQFRLAKDLRCISIENYGSSARMIDEIGRMIGGWLRQRGRTPVDGDSSPRK